MGIDPVREFGQRDILQIVDLRIDVCIAPFVGIGTRLAPEVIIENIDTVGVDKQADLAQGIVDGIRHMIQRYVNVLGGDFHQHVVELGLVEQTLFGLFDRGQVVHDRQAQILRLGFDDLAGDLADQDLAGPGPDRHFILDQRLGGRQIHLCLGCIFRSREKIQLRYQTADRFEPPVAKRGDKGIVDIEDSTLGDCGDHHRCRIDLENLVEALQGFLFTTEILANAKEAVLVVPTAHPDPGFNRDSASIFPGQGQRADICLTSQHVGKDLLSGLTQFWRMHIQQVHVLQIRQGVTQFGCDCRVDVQGPAVEVCDEDHVVDGFDEQAEIGQRRLEFLFDKLLARDVAGDAHGPQHLTLAVAHRGFERVKQHQAAIWVCGPFLVISRVT